MRSPDFDLYLVTDRHQTSGRELLWIVERALEAGVKAIQLREKDLAARDLLLLAERTRSLCQNYHAAFIINDRIDVALAVDADGVQLGKTSLPLEMARDLLGRKKLLGVSTHSLQEAQQAAQCGADFVLFGPVYFTASKTAYGAPQGLTALKEIVEKISLPVYAIGGITTGNIREAKNTGIRGVALISAIMSADDPKDAATRLLAGLK
ncbi:MAG: thiamine phosphate synthase [Candidatus Binatia bacterium]